MEETSISVIVPVYNAEASLDRLVDSVLAQRFEDWELLLVDDGSADASLALCRTRAAEDGRIRVLHQANAGPSAARNLGLDAARGACVAFLDADDAYLPETLGTLYGALRDGQADCACCGYVFDYGSGQYGETVPPPLSPGLHSPDEVRDGVLLPLFQERLRADAVTGMVWRWLFRRADLEGVRFPVEFSYLEDELFLLRYLAAAPRRLACVSEGLYAYYQNPASITRRYSPGFTEDYLRFLDEKAALAEARALPVRPDWRDNCAWLGLLTAVGNEFAPGGPDRSGAHRQNLKRLCRIPAYRRALEHYVPRGLNRRKALVAGLLRMRAYGLLTLLYTAKNHR